MTINVKAPGTLSREIQQGHDYTRLRSHFSGLLPASQSQAAPCHASPGQSERVFTLLSDPCGELLTRLSHRDPARQASPAPGEAGAGRRGEAGGEAGGQAAPRQGTRIPSRCSQLGFPYKLSQALCLAQAQWKAGLLLAQRPRKTTVLWYKEPGCSRGSGAQAGAAGPPVPRRCGEAGGPTAKGGGAELLQGRYLSDGVSEEDDAGPEQ